MPLTSTGVEYHSTSTNLFSFSINRYAKLRKAASELLSAQMVQTTIASNLFKLVECTEIPSNMKIILSKPGNHCAANFEPAIREATEKLIRERIQITKDSMKFIYSFATS